MTKILRAHGGTLDKYMGDGIMAFFGDGEVEGGGEEAEEQRVEHHAANAVRAALAMQKKMSELNLRWLSKGQETHLVRIGINTGWVTLGNLGTEFLWDYTVIGPEVNKTQRLERAAEAGGMLLSRRTYALAQLLDEIDQRPDSIAPAPSISPFRISKRARRKQTLLRPLLVPQWLYRRHVELIRRVSRLRRGAIRICRIAGFPRIDTLATLDALALALQCAMQDGDEHCIGFPQEVEHLRAP